MSFPWSPGGDFGSPTYSVPIKIVDGVRSSLTGERRMRWREALTIALERWGLPFIVSRRSEAHQEFVATDETISTLGIDPLIVTDAVAIVRAHFATPSDSAGWVEAMTGGICLLTPWRAWWEQGGRSAIAAVTAHELGHALGFGHGGTGVMVGRSRPNEEERALAAEYYL